MPEPKPQASTGTRVDLHTHSTFSDGELTPEQLLEEALWRGIGALALTDHDCVDGLDEARAAGASRSIEIISGVELSCELNGLEAHLIGLFIEPDQSLRAVLKKMQNNREGRMGLMLQKLQEMNINIRMDELPQGEKQSLGRPHLARLLQQKGYVRNFGEAFERYIGDNGPAYVPKERWTVPQGLDLIHSSRGISILAHPGASGLVPFIADFAALGIMGLEVHYPKHQPNTEQKLLAEAQRLGLLVSGGSDFHSNHNGPALGTPFIPREVLERIRQHKEKLWPAS